MGSVPAYPPHTLTPTSSPVLSCTCKREKANSASQLKLAPVNMIKNNLVPVRIPHGEQRYLHAEAGVFYNLPIVMSANIPFHSTSST